MNDGALQVQFHKTNTTTPMTESSHSPSNPRIKNPKVRSFVISILAGGTAGTVEVCTMYPLDLVKTQAVSRNL